MVKTRSGSHKRKRNKERKKTKNKKSKTSPCRPLLKIQIKARKTRSEWHRIVNKERENLGLAPNRDSKFYSYSFVSAIQAVPGVSHAEFTAAVSNYKKKHTSNQFVRLMTQCGLHQAESKDNKIKFINIIMGRATPPPPPPNNKDVTHTFGNVMYQHLLLPYAKTLQRMRYTTQTLDQLLSQEVLSLMEVCNYAV